MVVSCMAQEKQPIDQPIIYLSYSYVYMCVFFSEHFERLNRAVLA